MVVRIRLVRWGRNDMRLFRIVVADQRRALYGKNIEHIGNWDPKVDHRTGCRTLRLKTPRLLYWLAVGAQPSKYCKFLFSKFNILPERPMMHHLPLYPDHVPKTGVPPAWWTDAKAAATPVASDLPTNEFPTAPRRHIRGGRRNYLEQALRTPASVVNAWSAPSTTSTAAAGAGDVVGLAATFASAGVKAANQPPKSAQQ